MAFVVGLRKTPPPKWFQSNPFGGCISATHTIHAVGEGFCTQSVCDCSAVALVNTIARPFHSGCRRAPCSCSSLRSPTNCSIHSQHRPNLSNIKLPSGSIHARRTSKQILEICYLVLFTRKPWRARSCIIGNGTVARATLLHNWQWHCSQSHILPSESPLLSESSFFRPGRSRHSSRRAIR